PRGAQNPSPGAPLQPPRMAHVPRLPLARAVGDPSTLRVALAAPAGAHLALFGGRGKSRAELCRQARNLAGGRALGGASSRDDASPAAGENPIHPALGPRPLSGLRRRGRTTLLRSHPGGAAPDAPSARPIPREGTPPDGAASERHSRPIFRRQHSAAAVAGGPAHHGGGLGIGRLRAELP